MELQFATIWEAIADAIPQQTAIVYANRRIAWADYEIRAAQLANALSVRGVGRESKVALLLYNGPEYIEAQFASFKLRAIPVNVNYRYLARELIYVLDNSDSEAVVYHATLGDRVARIRDYLPGVKVWIEVDDGGNHVDRSVAYEDLLSAFNPLPRIERSGDDTYMLYTGGTTGMPKGVMYHQAPFIARYLKQMPALLGRTECRSGEEAVALVRELADDQALPSAMPVCPLMHGSGQWAGVFASHLFGGKTVLLSSRHLDAGEVWAIAEREAVNSMVIVGDAFARPLLRHLTETQQPYDLSALRRLYSSGAILSAEIKDQLLDHVRGLTIVDTIGGSEGTLGSSVTTRGGRAETAAFQLFPSTKVFTDDGTEVVPGSGEIGYLAAGGSIPYGYYKDAEKSTATFREINGVRYAFLGDMATVQADGSIHLIGRGNNCINTGGEKVFPEEVEEVVKTHPAVDDCLVFGVSDQQFGQKVVAVVETRPGRTVTDVELTEYTRERLAGYKAPREIKFIEQVPRTASGKADYLSARTLYGMGDQSRAGS